MKKNFIFRLSYFLFRSFGRLLPDRPYIKMQFYFKMGQKLNLNNPQTFNEKLNWLKLYDRNPLYTTLVDKYAVKKWVADKIGEQYIIPTLGVWNKPEDIEWDILPDQFVLKTTHGGGGDGVLICYDKNTFDKNDAITKLKKAMKTDPYIRLREWPYKNVPHRIIAEKYLFDSSTNDLKDYKFFGFDGVCKALFIASDRQTEGTEVKFNFFDSQFRKLDLVQTHPMSDCVITKPDCFEEMKRLTEKITKGMPEARCDFYEVNGKAYFGEITFFHHGGVTPFHPESWDKTWGEWISLPEPNDEWGGVIIRCNIVIYVHLPKRISLIDYKVHNFDGIPKMILVCQDRFSKNGPSKTFYDIDWGIMNLSRRGCCNHALVEKPQALTELLYLSKVLSNGLPFVRSDFYIIDNKVYFSEMTFFPGGAVQPFKPESWDYELGRWLCI